MPSPTDVGFGSLLVSDVTEQLLGWSGDQVHLDYVYEAVALADEGETLFVAGRLDSGEIIAYGGVDFRPEPNAGKLWMLVVHPEMRGQGIGTQLIDELEAAAAKTVDRVMLHVEKHNEGAKRLYERLGYSVTGEDTSSWDQLNDEGERYVYVAQVWAMEKDLTAKSPSS